MLDQDQVSALLEALNKDNTTEFFWKLTTVGEADKYGDRDQILSYQERDRYAENTKDSAKVLVQIHITTRTAGQGALASLDHTLEELKNKHAIINSYIGAYDHSIRRKFRREGKELPILAALQEALSTSTDDRRLSHHLQHCAKKVL
jgi:hypothetical protein